MKKLCGLACLIVGVLLGAVLVAPLPSEASLADVTFQLDSGNIVHILGPAATCPSGYNVCYQLNFNAANAVGNNSKSYKIVTHPGTSATGPKLYLNDIAGADSMKFNGVDFVPTTTSSWPNSETHVLTIKWTYTFDGSVNTNNSGHQGVGLSLGGYLQGGGTPAYTQYDYLQFDGTGTFSPSVVNAALLNVAPAILPNPAADGITYDTTVLKFPGIANQASITYWTLSQNIAFPTFGCDADGSGSGTSCKQTVTPRLTATLYGPDTLALTSSAIVQFSGTCKVTPADPGVTEPSGNPIPCHANGKKGKTGDDIITQAITNQVNTDIAEGIAAGGVAAIACTAADNCPCADPYDPQCAGTIVFVGQVTPAADVTFPFTADGAGIAQLLTTPPIFTIETNEVDANNNLTGFGRKPFSPLPAVSGGPWTFTAGAFPRADGSHIYDIDSLSCQSTLEPTVPLTSKLDGFTTWTADSGPIKKTVQVFTLKGGDTLTCLAHIHKTAG